MTHRRGGVQVDTFTSYLCPQGVYSRHVYVAVADTPPMGDFMAVLGIIAFIVVMLGLIWGLEHV